MVDLRLEGGAEKIDFPLVCMMFGSSGCVVLNRDRCVTQKECVAQRHERRVETERVVSNWSKIPGAGDIIIASLERASDGDDVKTRVRASLRLTDWDF